MKINNAINIAIETLCNSGIIEKTTWSREEAISYFQFLYSLVKWYSPTIILECGTNYGLSTLAFAMATSGDVYSLDIRECVFAREFFKSYPNVEFLCGDAIRVGEKLLQTITPDFVYLDAEHSTKGIIREFEIFKSAPLILIHDTFPYESGVRAMKILGKRYSNRENITLTFLKGFTLWSKPN